MAFLTKKEQSLIAAINSRKDIPKKEKSKLVQQVNYNAGLRQHGWRLPVRMFIQAYADHQTDKLSKAIQ